MNIAEIINYYGGEYTPYIGKVVNHLPMVQWALYSITNDVGSVVSLTDEIKDMYKFERVQEFYPKIESYEQALGKRDMYESCLDFINKEVEEKGIDEVIRYVLNTYDLGLSSGIYHPLIRLGYAVEGMESFSELEDEVKRSLAYYITSYRECKIFTKRIEIVEKSDIKKLFTDKEIEKVSRSEDSLGLRMKALYNSKYYLDNGFLIGGDEEYKIRSILDLFIHLYEKSPNVVLYHSITAIHSVLILNGYFDDFSRALDIMTTSLITHVMATDVEYMDSDNFSISSPLTWECIYSKVAGSVNAHNIKLIYSSYELDKIFGIKKLKDVVIKKIGI